MLRMPARLTLLLLAFFGFTLLHAQNVPLNSYENIGFERGDFYGWRGEYGTTRDNIFGKLIEDNVKQGILQGRQTIVQRRSYNRYDPFIYPDTFPMVNTGNFSVRLGNSSVGAEFERLMTTFRVTAENTLFVYRFAVVLQDPNHKPVQQPKFDVRVLDGKNKTVSCGYYRVASASNIPGFKNQRDLRYRPWTTAAIDLRDHIGELITIQFTTYDCTEGQHFGYAYIDAECMSSRIFPSYFCPGLDTTLTLNAPEGFESYRWSNGQRTRSITVKKPAPGTKYTVYMKPFSSLSDNCEYPLEFIMPERFDRPLLAEDTVKFCGSSNISVKSLDQNFDAFEWTYGKNGPVVSSASEVQINKPGRYFLRAKDRSCTFVDSLDAKQFPEPVLNYATESPICANQNTGKINLKSPPSTDLQFLWSTGDTSASIVNLPTGLYTVTITDRKKGCSIGKTFDFPDLPTYTANAQLLRAPNCDSTNSSGSAEVKILGGQAPYRVRWSNGDTSRLVKINAAGWYSVKITDAKGCIQQDSIQARKLQIETITVDPKCAGDKNGSINVVVQGGVRNYRYRLGNGALGSDSLFQQLAPGTYPITIQDQNGCVQKTAVTLLAPPSIPASFKIAQPRCAADKNGSIELSTPRIPGLSFRWSTGDTTTALRNLAAGGTFRVSVTDQIRGCTLEQSFNFPSLSALAASAKLLRSPGCDSTGTAKGSAEVKVLGGNGPYRIQWSNGDTARTMSIANAGFYRVTITDANGCRQLDSLLARKMAVETLVVPNDCAGDKKGSIRVQVRGGLPDYRIKFGSKEYSRDSIFQQLSGGKYQISVLDPSGCKFSKTINLPDPPPLVIALPKDTVVKLGATLVLRAQASERLKSFLWKSDDKAACTTCPELTLTRLLNSQTVTLNVVSPKNCTASAALRITVQKDYHVYIPNAFSPNGDNHNDFFELFLGASAERVRLLQVFTRWGEMVFSFDADAGAGEPRWDGVFRGAMLDNEVLVYKAEVDFIDGERKQFAGSLVIVK